MQIDGFFKRCPNLIKCFRTGETSPGTGLAPQLPAPPLPGRDRARFSVSVSGSSLRRAELAPLTQPGPAAPSFAQVWPGALDPPSTPQMALQGPHAQGHLQVRPGHPRRTGGGAGALRDRRLQEFPPLCSPRSPPDSRSPTRSRTVTPRLQDWDIQTARAH